MRRYWRILSVISDGSPRRFSVCDDILGFISARLGIERPALSKSNQGRCWVSTYRMRSRIQSSEGEESDFI